MNIGCRTQVNLSRLGMDSKQELERLCKGKQKIAKYPEKKETKNQRSISDFSTEMWLHGRSGSIMMSWLQS
jgi:hypothetical protein